MNTIQFACPNKPAEYTFHTSSFILFTVVSPLRLLSSSSTILHILPIGRENPVHVCASLRTAIPSQYLYQHICLPRPRQNQSHHRQQDHVSLSILSSLKLLTSDKANASHAARGDSGNDKIENDCAKQEGEEDNKQETTRIVDDKRQRPLIVPDGDNRSARKRIKRSPSSSVPYSTFRDLLAQTSAHPRFRDTITIGLEAGSALEPCIGTTDTDCAICWEPFSSIQPQSLARHAQCAPLYHTACLEQWTEQGSPTCPYCRARLLALPQAQQLLPTIFGEDADNVPLQGLSDFVVTDTLEADDWGLSDEEVQSVRAFLGLLTPR